MYTTKKELTLTFSGMGDEKMMKQILDELDKFKIKAVFFLPGIRGQRNLILHRKY